MHWSQLIGNLTSGRIRFTLVVALLMILGLTVAACQPVAQPQEPAPVAEEAEEPAAEEAEEPADEEPADEEPADEEPADEEPADDMADHDMMEGMVGDALNGGYLVTIAGGCGCHFNRDAGALAGGNDFDGDFGVVYASNITPDPETGIGNWSEAEIAHVLHTGMRPDGTQLAPVMPYMAYSVLSQQGALDIAAYLLALDPVANEVPARDVSEPFPAFMQAVEPPAQAPEDPVARGEELVTIARCTGCHTPRGEEGMFLAGAPLRDDFAANITPDEATGIGSWSEEAIATYLRTGVGPDDILAEGAMLQQIERRFNVLTEEDALAIAAFLKSIPAVENAPPGE